MSRAFELCTAALLASAHHSVHFFFLRSGAFLTIQSITRRGHRPRLEDVMPNIKDRSLVIWRGKQTRGREGNETLREWGEHQGQLDRMVGWRCWEAGQAPSWPVGNSPQLGLHLDLDLRNHPVRIHIHSPLLWVILQGPAPWYNSPQCPHPENGLVNVRTLRAGPPAPDCMKSQRQAPVRAGEPAAVAPCGGEGGTFMFYPCWG